jgi:hypothetical protein
MTTRYRVECESYPEPFGKMDIQLKSFRRTKSASPRSIYRYERKFYSLYANERLEIIYTLWTAFLSKVHQCRSARHNDDRCATFGNLLLFLHSDVRKELVLIGEQNGSRAYWRSHLSFTLSPRESLNQELAE